MAGRRRVRTASSSPRYRLKMFDYLSKGGRIPAFLVQPAVEAMDVARAEGFAYYTKLAEKELIPILEDYGISSALHGLARAFYYRAVAEIGDRWSEDVIDKVIEGIRSEYDGGFDVSFWNALKEALTRTRTLFTEHKTKPKKTKG